jgi:hypothetical protein
MAITLEEMKVQIQEEIASCGGASTKAALQKTLNSTVFEIIKGQDLPSQVKATPLDTNGRIAISFPIDLALVPHLRVVPGPSEKRREASSD